MDEINADKLRSKSRDEMRRDTLHLMAERYIWWKDPDDPTIAQRYVIARVMSMGSDGDVDTVQGLFGIDALRDALRNAEAGWFDNWRAVRSWRYWHQRLGLTTPGEDAPPLPKRPFL